MNGNEFSYGAPAFKQKAPVGVKGRNTFIPVIDSPGPAAYHLNETLTIKNTGQVPFGTADRENEEARFISEMHQRQLPAIGVPGPGTYRTHKMGKKFLSRSAPSWCFGSASQRTDSTKLPAASIPGAIYNQELPNISHSYSFAPPEDIQSGANMSRSNNLFISKGHAEADRSTLKDVINLRDVAPGAYEAVPLDCLYHKAGTAVFGKSKQFSTDSLNKVQQALVPLAGTPAYTPGAHYIVEENMGKGKGPKFPKGAKFYRPEDGNSHAGPYLGKGHESSSLNVASPGPCAYKVDGMTNRVGMGLGAAERAVFGTSERTPVVRQKVPGPGAYAPKDDTSSGISHAPACSMGGGFGRGELDVPHMRHNPGPGAYSADDSSTTHMRKPAQYSMGKPPEHRVGHEYPGPASYDTREDSTSPRKGRGYSFGMKEKTVDPRSTVSVRYHGPLACHEAYGTQSPGPGLYDTRNQKPSNIREPPSSKFATSTREAGSKMYISAMHAQSDGLGVHGPGPGAYEVQATEIEVVTSKFRKTAVASFSTTDRFGARCMTF